MGKIRTNQKTEKTSGITLIALVITIIVLLILAAISISTLTGENGLLTKADEASNKTTESGAMEKIKVSVGESYDERGKFDSEEFKRRIVEKGGSIITESSTDIVVEMDGYQATVDKQTGEIKDIVTAEEGLKPIEKVTDENPGELAGSGTEEEPYLIQSIEDLVGLSNSVSPIKYDAEDKKEYKTYEGEYFKLEITLDFASRDSYVNPDRTDFGDANGDGTSGTLIEEMTTGAGFRPIGKSSYAFNGNIDGNNKEIRSMLVKGNGDIGFIGYSGGNSVEISNLNMVNVNIESSGTDCGGIIGYCSTINTIIENCSVSGNISGSSFQCGAMIGYAVNYESSILSLKLINNTNKATITANQRVSGILGYVDAENGELILSNNINKGTINASSSVGGIIGRLVKVQSAKIENNNNEGKIIAGSSKGGIIGEIYSENSSGSEISILSNVNNATIIGNGARIGGIVGEIQSLGRSTINIIDCHNKGNIEQSTYATSGIVGYISSCKEINIKDCDNEGSIQCVSGYQIGGIIGRAGGSYNIYNCYNKGNITVGDENSYHVGGIVGANESYDSNTIEKCYNLGNIKAARQIGGIIGNLSSDTKVEKCYNSGNLEANNEIGGISYSELGKATITNCYNTGTITALTTKAPEVGGIVSRNEGPITKCYNTGEIIITSVNNDGYIGGIIGKGDSGGEVEKTYNLGKITIVDGTCERVGSVVGYVTSTGKIKNNAYLASTYEKGMGGDNEDSDTTTKAIENIEDLYTLINQNLTEADGWILEKGEELPTIKFEEE